MLMGGGFAVVAGADPSSSAAGVNICAGLWRAVPTAHQTFEQARVGQQQ
jgi:hypothetical protein